MNSRDAILDAIARAGAPRVPRKAPQFDAKAPGDLIERFTTLVSQVAGRCVQRPVTTPLESLLDTEFPGGRQGVAVLRGRFGVAENGAVYVDADDIDERKLVVAAEHLVLLVDAASLVPTMHEAVRRMPPNSRCGWFLSGPSKTADIEQALVIGAQGARTLLVVLEP